MIELIIRIGFSLLVVLALMWGMAKVARRPLTGGRGGGVLAVLAREQLTKGAAVAVVRVADRALVLGVTDAGVSLLSVTDLATVDEYRHEPVSRRERLEVAGLPARHDGKGPASAGPPRAVGHLAGSVLSPTTWRQVMEFVRQRTARRP